MHQTLQISFIKTLKTYFNLLPIVTGMLVLISLAINVFPEQISTQVFGTYDFFDAFFGALIGSVAVGLPLASYVLAGELLATGMSMFAVTALVVSWVTVGVAQLPAEALENKQVECIEQSFLVAFEIDTISASPHIVSTPHCHFKCLPSMS